MAKELKDFTNISNEILAGEINTSRILVQETSGNSYGYITLQRLRDIFNIPTLSTGNVVSATLTPKGILILSRDGGLPAVEVDLSDLTGANVDPTEIVYLKSGDSYLKNGDNFLTNT